MLSISRLGFLKLFVLETNDQVHPNPPIPYIVRTGNEARVCHKPPIGRKLYIWIYTVARLNFCKMKFETHRGPGAGTTCEVPVCRRVITPCVDGTGVRDILPFLARYHATQATQNLECEAG